MPSSGRKKFLKPFIVILLLLLAFETAGMFLILPKTARAAGEFDAPAFGQRQLISGSEQSVEEARRAADKTEEKVKEVKLTVAQKLFKGLILTAAVTLKNTLVAMAKTAAEQTVTWLSTGSWGEGPMFYDKAFSTFKDDFLNQAVGQFLDNINDLFGIDICHPEIPYEFSLKLFLLKEGYADLKKPDCSLAEFKHNWSAFLENIQDKYKAFKDDPAAFSVGVLQETVTVAFTRESTEIGGLIVVKEKMKQKIADDYNAKRDDRLESQGSKPVTDILGEFIETPAYLTRSHTAAELEKAKETPQSEVNTSKEVITEIPGQVGVAFFNSFISKFWTDYILAKIFNKGLVSPKPTVDGVFDVKGQMKTEFANQKINYSFAQKQIDLLSEFATCSDPRQINNCVMDNDFADAVREATQNKPMTVAEAIALGRLNGKKLLIGPNDERNSSDDCYEIGFCYSNLVKLRTARIIPIGWEIAAKLTNKGEEFSLQAAIDDFNKSTSKYFHLIDPNWVLRYPQTQCKAYVNGPLIVAPKAAERAEVCVDAQSCLKTDDKGKCQAWGYCGAEKNIFRFSGQECQGVYDSCQTYKGPKGKEVSFVSNTVDKAYCSADNAGCLWYSKDKVNKNGALDPWSSGATHDKRIYLNGKITDQECAPNQEGCNRFISTEAGLGTNLLKNSGFEIFSESNKVIDNVSDWSWQKYDNGGYVDDNALTSLSDLSFSGVKAAKITASNRIISEKIVVAPKPFIRYFAVSAQIKKEDANGEISAEVSFDNLTDNIYATLVYPANPLVIINGQATYVPVYEKSFSISNKDQWENIKAIFSFGPSASAASFKLDEFAVAIKAIKGIVFVDNILLEELDGPLVASMHVYSDYATQNAVYVKKAPEYLKCYDTKGGANPGLGNYGRPAVEADINKANDVAGKAKQKGCKDFAQLCTAEDVGCAAYKPTDKGSTINGVVSYSDYCPQECSGYASYAKSATNFENSEFPLYFISSTAQQCSETDAGCDEFTNLDVLPQGGEAKEYYKELRMCVELPEGKDKCSTYYTWEGSEVTGYQLQAHELEKNNSDGSPALVDASYASQCDATIFAKKDNPDCRQFFDAGGKAYYKLFSKTILCTTDCHPYRRTDKYATAKDCTDKKGEFKDNECVFMAVPTASIKCSAQNNGCREYRGNQAGVEFELENYTFSGVGGAGPLEKLKVLDSQLQTSPEFGQYLTVKSTATGLPAPNAFIAKLNTDYSKLIFAPGEYRISFWLRNNIVGDSTFWVDAGNFKNDTNKIVPSGGQVPVKGDWQFFTYNFTVDALNSANFGIGIGSQSAFDIDNLKIVKTKDLKYLIRSSWITPTSCDYKLNSNLNDVANYLPQAQLGCREFKTADGGTSYLKSLSGLCSAEKVGCQAMIDTQGNEYPFEKEFNKDEFKCDYSVPGNTCIFELDVFKGSCTAKGGMPDTAGTSCVYNSNITVPDDSLLYLVVNDKVKCPASEKGCTALGLPTLTVDDNGDKVVKTKVIKDENGNDVTEWLWNNLFYKLDPENFASDSKNYPLCKSFESDCEKYDSEDSKSSYYFKNPGDKMCEWRQGYLYGAGGTDVDQKVYAWFKKKTDPKATDVKCTDVKEYYADASANVFRNTDENYSGWTASCPKSQDKCTAFLDPTDMHIYAEDDLGYPKAYYYLNNENVDTSSCTSVSRKEGCVLFNDTSSAALTFTTTSTYQNSKKSAGGLVSAVPSQQLADINECKDKKLNLKYYACLMENTVNSDVDGIEKTKCITDNPNQAGEDQSCTEAYYLNHGDTNTIIKVTRDRECSAWYDCKSSHWVWNPNKSKYEEVCDQVGLCDQLDAGSESAKCKNFVDGENTVNLLSRNEILNGVQEEGGLLDKDKVDNTLYNNRPTDWFALEYTGLAVPYLAPAQFYNAFDIAQGSGKKTCGGSFDGTDCSKNADVCEGTDQSCETLVDYRLVNADDKECKKSTIATDCKSFCGAADVSNNDKCRCLSNVCTKPFSGGKFTDSKEPACRAYPEKDSPFPASTASNVNFEGVNISYVPEDDPQIKQDGDFACDYRKITYGGGSITKYLPRYPEYSPAPAKGFCADEPTTSCECDGKDTISGSGSDAVTILSIKTNSMCMSTKCNGSSDSNDGEGMCFRLDSNKKSKDYTGWEGYCLEEDVSLVKDGLPNEHPCLTWYPTQAMPGLQDFQNQYDNAGFFPANYGFTSGGPYFCTDSKRFEFRESWFAISTGTYKNFPPVVPSISISPTKDVVNLDEPHEVLLAEDIKLKGGGTYKLGDGYGDVGDVNIGEPAPDEAWNALVNSFVGSNSGIFISPALVCSGNGANKYTAANLYDVDQELVEDKEEELLFQCTPKNEVNGKGWFYDSAGKKDDLDVYPSATYERTGFDNKDDSGNEDPYKEKCTIGSESVACKSDDYEMEKQSCTQLYAMADDNGENKAFTNRIYKGAAIDVTGCKQGVGAKTGISKVAINAGCAINYNPGATGLYGSLSYNGASEGLSKVWNLFLDDVVSTDGFVADKNDCIGIGADTAEQKTPYGSGVTWGSTSIYQGGLSCLDKPDLQTLFAESHGFWDQVTSANNSNGKPTASDEIKFNKLVNANDWDLFTGMDEAFKETIIPPTISAVVATTKFDNNGKTIYAAVPNKITVSTPDTEKTEGNIIFHGTQLPVSVKFYAWASDDQMPLRSIVVKFGDGAIIFDGLDGGSKFQNHKPRCQREEHEKLGICNAPGGGKVYSGYACAEKSDCSHMKMECILEGNYEINSKYIGYNLNEPYKDDRFGDTSQACLETYFQYNHTYSCDKSSATDTAPNGEKACKFEIGVQAKDNWGWCNGNHYYGGPTGELIGGAYGDGTPDACDMGQEKNKSAAEYYDGYIYMIP